MKAYVNKETNEIENMFDPVGNAIEPTCPDHCYVLEEENTTVDEFQQRVTNGDDFASIILQEAVLSSSESPQATYNRPDERTIAEKKGKKAKDPVTWGDIQEILESYGR